MPNSQSFLDLLVTDDSLDDLFAIARANYSLTLDGIYCYHTGKLIGHFTHDELREAIYEEGDLDDESMVDALIVRVVNSMRPSPAFNRPDMGTIRETVQRRPIDALAYLLNRFLHPLTLKRTYDESHSALLGRIQTYQWCMTLNAEQLRTFTHWLLALDSQFGLSTIEPPKGIAEPESIEQAVALIEKFAITRLNEVKDHYIRTETANSLTRGALIRSTLDNPEIANRKAAAAWAAKNKPGRTATPKKVSKTQEKLNRFLGILDGVFEASQPAPVTPKPVKIITGSKGLFANRKPKES